MRLLILSQYFWPESFPISTLVDALEAAGADVTVLTGQPNYPEGVVFPGYRAATVTKERYGRATDVFRLPTVPRGNASALRLAANYVSFVVAASLIGPWLLRRRAVDVILVYAPSPITQVIPGIVLKRLKAALLVTWVQDLWPQSLEGTGFVRNRRLLAGMEGFVRWLYARNDHLLGQSKAFVSAIRRLAGTTPVSYFPNPGGATWDAADAPAAPAVQLPSGFNVVFAGNLGRVQALDTVLDAATLLRNEPDVRFVLVGSGSRSAWLASEIERRSLSNVLLPGRFDAAAMPGILRQASALLVSLARDEILRHTIPGKVQTYLAAGRPILASLDGEAADLIEAAEAGLSSPAEDAASLAENVRRLRRAGADEQIRMGVNARRCYDGQFRSDTLARQLLSELADVVDKLQGPRSASGTLSARSRHR